MTPHKIVSLITVTVTLAVMTAESSNIKESCQGFTIDDSGVFAATCRGSGNSLVSTKLDLNLCLLNEIGFLHFEQNGNFTYEASCIGCSTEPQGYDSTFIMCSCVDYRSGVRHTTGIELSQGLSNDNGVFSCFGAKGAS